MSNNVIEDVPPPYSATDTSACNSSSPNTRQVLFLRDSIQRNSLPPPIYTCVAEGSVPPTFPSHSQPDTSQPQSASSTKLHFCESCRQAQEAFDYHRRILGLYKDVFCSVCNKRHAGIYFSQYQQSQPDSIRRCITYEGYISICPHLHITLDQVRTALQRNNRATWKCLEGLCRYKNATFTMVKSDSPLRYMLHMNWETGERLSHEQSEIQDPDLSQVPKEGMCPHHMVQPLELNHAANYTPSTWQGYQGRMDMNCKMCLYSIVYFRPSQGESDQTGFHYGIERYCVIFDDKNKFNTDWQRSLNPESVGLFRDEKWKNIVWCGDVRCSTSRGLARYDTLRGLGLLGESHTDASRAIQALDVGTRMRLGGS